MRFPFMPSSTSAGHVPFGYLTSLISGACNIAGTLTQAAVSARAGVSAQQVGMQGAVGLLTKQSGC